MKKYLALLCAAIMALALYGCGNNTPAAPETEQPEQGTETPGTPETPNALDYASTGISDWTYGVADADENVTKHLMTIDMAEYGTAGSSMKQAVSGAAVLSLIGQEDFAEKAAAYLDGMNDIQRDYFSFQWQNAVKTAETILTDFETMQPVLGDAGHPDFSVEGIAAEDLTALNTQMTGLLSERGITDQWKNFPDVEPFNMFAPRSILDAPPTK